MYKHLVFLCCFVLFSTKLCAQIELPSSLEDAVNAAVLKSLNLQNQALEVDKLNLEVKSVKGLNLPRVEATALYSYFRTDLRADVATATLPISGLQVFDGVSNLSLDGNFFQGGVMAKTILFGGMQIKNASKAIEEKAIGTSYLMQAERDELVQEVIHTFDQLYLIQASEALLDDSRKRLEKENLRLEKAIANGLAIPYDRDKIKLAQLELQSKSVELKGAKKVLYQKITYLTGYSESQTEAVLYDLEPYLLFDDSFSVEEKQELKALESFKVAYEYLLKKERGSFLPSLGAFAGVSYTSVFDANVGFPSPVTGNNLNVPINEFTLFPNIMAGVALKWEIFSGFERKHKIEEAKINIMQIENKRNDAKQKLELQLDFRMSNYNVMLEKIELAEQQYKVAENNLTMATKQYQEGLIGISDRLEAENDLYKAAQNKVNVIINQRLAAIEVMMSTGKIYEDMSTNK